MARHSEASRSQSVQRLENTVISGGYCIGCGACSAVSGSPLRIEQDGVGRLQARVDSASGAAPAANVEDVCPFSATAASEDEIANSMYAAPDAEFDKLIGWCRGIWAGHVREDDFRERGSSGGMGNWLAAELLRRGEVDAVLHVQPMNNGRLFGYSVSCSIEDIKSGAKSRYYPVEMSNVFALMRSRPGRYALIGVPCFIKAARLLARQDDTMRDRLCYTIAIVCGHLKTESFAGMFSWQSGIHPDKLSEIDFRVKNKDGPANQYSIRTAGYDDSGAYVNRVRRNKSFFGHLWGHGFFKYRACDYCDDVMGETADVTVGDAWLPDYIDDPRGSNIVVSRSLLIDAIIREGIERQGLELTEISREEAALSQAAGLRHRRDGLSVRLARAARRRRWTPPKRVAAGTGNLPWRKRLVYRIREDMSERSHAAFREALAAGKFEVFVNKMRPWIVAHDLANSNKGLSGTTRQVLVLLLRRLRHSIASPSRSAKKFR